MWLPTFELSFCGLCSTYLRMKTKLQSYSLEVIANKAIAMSYSCDCLCFFTFFFLNNYPNMLLFSNNFNSSCSCQSCSQCPSFIFCHYAYSYQILGSDKDGRTWELIVELTPQSCFSPSTFHQHLLSFFDKNDHYFPDLMHFLTKMLLQDSHLASSCP